MRQRVRLLFAAQHRPPDGSHFPVTRLAPPINLGFNLNNLGYLFVAASKTVATNPGFRTTSSGISNMPRLHNSAWLRPALAFLALAGLLALAACGGGSGAVQAPGNVQTPPTAVTVIPETQTIYPGTPASFTISGGVPPYQAFSSNSAILPVAQSVAGNQVVLLANSISAATTVTVTIQDAVGQTAAATVQVSPAVGCALPVPLRCAANVRLADGASVWPGASVNV